MDLRIKAKDDQIAISTYIADLVKEMEALAKKHAMPGLRAKLKAARKEARRYVNAA